MTEKSTDPKFANLPDLLEECRTEEEAQLHQQRAALRMKERYSHLPYYAERAKRNPDYWKNLASSAVNI